MSDRAAFAALTPDDRAKLDAMGGWLAVALGEEFGADVRFAAIWQEIQRRIRAGVTEEREACAKLCDFEDLAAAIRRRNDA